MQLIRLAACRFEIMLALITMNSYRRRSILALFSALGFCFSLAVAPAGAGVVPRNEVFANASDGTALHWDVYTPTTPGPWPAVLVIHGGGFDAGSPTSSPESVTCAQDLAAAGYIAFSIEYRLAPPGFLPGQRSAGYFPDQTSDVKLAVRTARKDPRCNGQVGAVGGSAGGYHAAFVATTGTPRDDRVDVAVSLSGAYDLSDESPSPNLTAFTQNVTNFVNVPVTDTAQLQAASPAWLADGQTAPLFLINTLEDPMPYSQMGDFIEHLDAAGVTNYAAASFPGQAHSFANWTVAKQAALAFLADRFAGVPSPPPLPTPRPGDLSEKLLNVSTRSLVSSGDDVMVGGFIVTGASTKRVVLRALGPSLGQSGVAGALADPSIALYDGAGTLMETNDNRLALTGVPNPLLPANAAESYLTAVLPAGNYTAVVQGANGASGVALVELYDLQPSTSRVANISTRADIANPGDAVIGGFIVGGTEPTRVIARALGSSLRFSGVARPLPDPALELHDSNGTLLYSNDNWRSTQAQEIIDTTIPPGDDREAAIVATLPPGGYTALVRDASGATGVSLVEVYNLAPQ